MKHYHFFGCSNTAGDELTDDVTFLWKSTCIDRYEYYRRRIKQFGSNGCVSYDQYQINNLALAYPAIIQGKLTDTTCHNYAVNGNSLKTIIFKILQVVATGQQIDHIFLQIPPQNREMFLTKQGEESLQLALIGQHVKFPYVDNYLKAKIMSHPEYTWAVEDYMDLNLISGYLSNRKISYTIYIIPTGGIDREFFISQQEVYKFLINFDFEMFDLIRVTNCQRNRTLGGHYNIEAHNKFADYLIDNYINQ
jgi:hypothetical protein